MKAFEKKQTGLITALDFKKKSVVLAYWLMFGALVVTAIVFLFPPLWVFMSSFKDIKEFLSSPPTFFPHSFQPEKLYETWKELNFTRYYVNTFKVAIGDLVFCVLFNGLAGYVISRLKPMGASFVFTMIVWTMMLPTSVSTVPLFMTFIKFPVFGFSMMNTYFPMWLMKGANAFFVLLFKNFFDTISMSYLEAARIDGCSDLGIFSRIIIPMSKPILAVVTIFSINATWAEFFWPYLVLTDKDYLTISVQLFKMKSIGFPMDKYIMALMFSVLPPAIVFIAFQKQMLKGISIGGIKG